MKDNKLVVANSDSIHSILTCFYKKTISIQIHVQLYLNHNFTVNQKIRLSALKLTVDKNPKYNKYTDISCFIVCLARGAYGVESDFTYFMLKLVANKIG